MTLRRRRRRRRCRRSGIALVTVLAAVAVTLAAMTAAIGAVVHAASDARLARLRASARLAAEGGIDAARAALARDAAWTGGTLDVDGVRVTVRVAPQASGAERVVHAVGRAAPHGDDGPAAQVSVEATLRIAAGALPAITRWSER